MEHHLPDIQSVHHVEGLFLTIMRRKVHGKIVVVSEKVVHRLVAFWGFGDIPSVVIHATVVATVIWGLSRQGLGSFPLVVVPAILVVVLSLVAVVVHDKGVEGGSELLLFWYCILGVLALLIIVKDMATEQILEFYAAESRPERKFSLMNLP